MAGAQADGLRMLGAAADGPEGVGFGSQRQRGVDCPDQASGERQPGWDFRT